MVHHLSLQVYEHEYKAVLDGVETDSVMEIEPYQRTEIFKMGNGSQEVVEVHDFQNVSFNFFSLHKEKGFLTHTLKNSDGIHFHQENKHAA